MWSKRKKSFRKLSSCVQFAILHKLSFCSRRLAALEQKEVEGHHRGSHAGAGASKPNPKYAALDKPDRDIALRLEKLKEKPQGM